MEYALNLSQNDGRILSATYSKYAPKEAVIVNELPDGDISDYRYENGNFIYDPVIVEEVAATPSQLDRIEAQVTYTAMMTDTLLEV